MRTVGSVYSRIPRDLPSWRQLRAFEAVARLESISAALEESVGARLFERQRTGCYITELGALWLPRVRRFFEHIRSAVADLSGAAYKCNCEQDHQATTSQPDRDF